MANKIPRNRARARSVGLLSLGAWSLVALMGAEVASAVQTATPPTVPRRPGSAAAAALAANNTPRPSSRQSNAPTSPAPSTPSTPAAPSGPAMTGSVGESGDNVKAIEQRLNALSYEVGAVDSTYDEDTAQGVTAFQKVHGMERTGTVTTEVWNRMTSAQTPQPLVPGGGSTRVEISLAQQVLFLYEGNKLSRIIPVSSGSEESYCENGSCGDAVTPTGDFRVYRQGYGWEYGPLGGLYNPAYFIGGVAIHGSRSVPPYPASHGCVRIPMSVAEWFPDRVPMGTPVFVR